MRTLIVTNSPKEHFELVKANPDCYQMNPVEREMSAVSLSHFWQVPNSIMIAPMAMLASGVKVPKDTKLVFTGSCPTEGTLRMQVERITDAFSVVS